MRSTSHRVHAHEVSHDAGEEIHGRQTRRPHGPLDERPRLPEREHVEEQVQDAVVEEARGHERLPPVLAHRREGVTRPEGEGLGLGQVHDGLARGEHQLHDEDGDVERQQRSRHGRLVEPARGNEAAAARVSRVAHVDGAGRLVGGHAHRPSCTTGAPAESSGAPGFLAVSQGLR